MKNVGILVNLKIISKSKTPYMKGTRIFKEKKGLRPLQMSLYYGTGSQISEQY